jgi:hypothetical protein
MKILGVWLSSFLFVSRKHRSLLNISPSFRMNNIKEKKALFTPTSVFLSPSSTRKKSSVASSPVTSFQTPEKNSDISILSAASVVSTPVSQSSSSRRYSDNIMSSPLKEFSEINGKHYTIDMFQDQDNENTFPFNDPVYKIANENSPDRYFSVSLLEIKGLLLDEVSKERSFFSDSSQIEMIRRTIEEETHLQQLLLQPIEEGSSLKVMDSLKCFFFSHRFHHRILRNSVNGNDSMMKQRSISSKSSPEGREREKLTYLCSQLRSLIREEILEFYFQFQSSFLVSKKGKVSSFSFSQVRFKSVYTRSQNMGNGLICMIGRRDAFEEIINQRDMNDNKSQWDHRENTHHEDRVASLCFLSLRTIYELKNNEKKWKHYFEELFTVNPSMIQRKNIKDYKIKIHFHLLDCLFPYLINLLKPINRECLSSSLLLPSSMHFKKSKELSDADYSHSSYFTCGTLVRNFLEHHGSSSSSSSSSINTALEEIGVMATVEIKSKKIVIDISGGKRELNETPLECATRETYEEIGFDFTTIPVQEIKEMKDGEIEEPRSKYDWIITEHVKLDDMSCFLVVHSSVLPLSAET